MVTDGRIIAVVGATGRQGGAVARHLLADGWQVRALTRRPASEPARKLAALGAEVVRADMADPAALHQAFRDAYGVYGVQNPMTSSLDAEMAHGKNVADAAKNAAVQHLVYGSAGTGESGTGVGSWDSKLAIEAYMRDLGLPLTVLRPMAFMELMTDKAYYPSVSTWRIMPKLMGADTPIYWISVDDLGAVAARVFADQSRFVGADIKLTADVLSNRETCEIWREVMGRAPRQFPMPLWMFERFVGTDLTTMWRWLRTANLQVDPAPTREILPNPTTVRQWLLHHRSPAPRPADRSPR